MPSPSLAEALAIIVPRELKLVLGKVTTLFLPAHNSMRLWGERSLGSTFNVQP